MTMQWTKHGLLALPSPPGVGWSHAMTPTPVLLDDRVRIYYSVRDPKGRSVPLFVDVDRASPTQVIGASPAPLLELGAPGAFDDNGVVPTSVLRAIDGRWFMYYVGFELCTQVRYRLLTGLAVSDDGLRWERYQSTAILDRSPGEELFRCGPFVAIENGRYRMWYIAGNRWAEVAGKALPVYELRHLQSSDGMTWGRAGTLSLVIDDPDEHGFGRPWVRTTTTGYEMFFSVRRRSLGGYRLGYATSTDGIIWHRDDARMNLDVSVEGFDSEMIGFAAPVELSGRDYCFYNGNDFGRDGIAIASRPTR